MEDLIQRKKLKHFYIIIFPENVRDILLYDPRDRTTRGGEHTYSKTKTKIENDIVLLVILPILC